MLLNNYPVEQTDPPRSPRETLPTMYDLPSEAPEDSGLPDEYHIWQPQLLSFGCCPPTYPPEQVFVASDLNLYYDLKHTQWYKRPDWFVVVGVSRLYDEREMRLSYVMWQEGVRPLLVVELLSPGTRDEDLGNIEAEEDKPPPKWEVYERILGVPYYVVFDRYNDKLQVFRLEGGHYKELDLAEPRVWIPEIELGLGLWQGEYRSINRLWLRWYDAEGNWILTEAEAATEAEQRAKATETLLEQERQRAERLAERLRAAGIDPDAE